MANLFDCTEGVVGEQYSIPDEILIFFFHPHADLPCFSGAVRFISTALCISKQQENESLFETKKESMDLLQWIKSECVIWTFGSAGVLNDIKIMIVCVRFEIRSI